MFYKGSSHHWGEGQTHKQNHKTENYARADVFFPKMFVGRTQCLVGASNLMLYFLF